MYTSTLHQYHTSKLFYTSVVEYALNFLHQIRRLRLMIEQSNGRKNTQKLALRLLDDREGRTIDYLEIEFNHCRVPHWPLPLSLLGFPLAPGARAWIRRQNHGNVG